MTIPLLLFGLAAGRLVDVSDAMITFYNDSSTRASLDVINSCGTYPANTFIPWTTIAKEWVKGGGRPEDCAAALIVASGETSCTTEGCLSVSAGIWQVTSPDMPAPSGCTDGNFNVCCGVDYVRNHITSRLPGSNKTTSWQIGCIGEFNAGGGWAHDPTNPNYVPPTSEPIEISKVVGEIVPEDHSGGGLGGTQSNWIGPFCHQGGFTCEANDPYCISKPQTGISGDNWGGGSQWAGTGQGQQIFPFPYYYYARFVESQGTDGMTGNMHCETVVPGANGTCGGVPSSSLPDCDQPVTGVAPSPLNQACFDRITETALQLAQNICSKA